MMRPKITILLLLSAVLFALTALQHSMASAARLEQGTGTTPLYDGRLGTFPDQQGFDLLVFPAGPSQIISGGSTILDTLASNGYYAGYFAKAAQTPTLDRTSGFTVVFTAALPVETHASDNRAGFSLLVLADDNGGSSPVRGIELGFWLDQVWAQDDDTQGGTLFSRAESAAFNTRPLTGYRLTIVGDGYTLWAGGSPLLNGRLRDYSSFAGSPDPYETPNLLFLGDDTSSAAARLRLSWVSLETPAGHYQLYLPLMHGR